MGGFTVPHRACADSIALKAVTYAGATGASLHGDTLPQPYCRQVDSVLWG